MYNVLWSLIAVSIECCGPATSSQCQAVCKAIFLEASLPSRSQRNAVAKHCDSHVATCIRNNTKGTPANDPTLSKSFAYYCVELIGSRTLVYPIALIFLMISKSLASLYSLRDICQSASKIHLL